MRESARIARNQQQLTTCYPWFAQRVARLLEVLEAAGERPRVQEAWRSPSEQIALFQAGRSKLRYGFHNVTGAHGTKEALAVDLLDDAHPLMPPVAYLIRLAHYAMPLRLTTGLAWGLPTRVAATVLAAARAGDVKYAGPVGWDPCHVQVAGLTPTQVRQGARPS